jgi:protein-S-isoprenylcysteine O-methyltransferase Ste14
MNRQPLGNDPERLVFSFVRQLFAFLALPFMATVLVPAYLLRRAALSGLHAGPVLRLGLLTAGVLFFVAGLALFVSSVLHFAIHGRGTLAPWDPPKVLVVTGPYRFVRNPMIAGVIFILLSEASLLLSAVLFVWAVTFIVVNLIYIPLFEEPALARRFGDSYHEYRAHVRRFLPRLRPWNPRPAPQSVG